MEDFVTFDLAKKLKEKGFPQRPDYFNYSSYFCWDGLRKIHTLYNASVWFDPNINRENIYFAPTIPQVLKWLRVDRCFHVSPDLMSDYSVDADDNICEEWTYWSYSIHHIIDGPIYRDYNQFDHIEYRSWEAAALEGITHVLDNLI